MRKPILMVVLTSGMMIASAMVEAQSIFYIPREVSIKVTPTKISVVKPKLEVKNEIPTVKNHSTFLTAIGFRESSGNYKAVNSFGYLGKYQFGRKTLNAIGFEKVSNREFLANPTIQEKAMLALLKQNKHTLRKEIAKYSGKVINGIYITESGILAAAHLAGAGNVKKFFRKGYEFRDGNGTKMTSYMKQFANYELNI
jgi:methanogenic corrinoid protein MtbC1